jgi:two-component system OmpR family sensor kinase
LRLQTRLTLTSAVLITAVSLAVGGASTIGAYQHEISSARAQLLADNKQITAAKGQELSTALLLSYQQDMTIGLIDSTKTLTVIKEGDVRLSKKPSTGLLRAAAKQADLRVSKDGKPYLLEAVSLANDEWVVLQLGVADAQARLMTALGSLVLYTAVADILAVLLVWVLIRRDLWQIRRLIGAAKRIASGGAAEFPSGSGTTEVEQLAESLKSMVLQLQSNEVEMQRFLGDASHELRTPLTVIRGYLEMLSNPERANAEFTSRAVSKMSGEVARMQRLIEDLLLLAELGSAGRPLDLGRVDLGQLLRSEVDSLQDLQPGRSVSLSMPEGPQAEVTADAGLLSQLFANLFSNIRRHTSSATTVEVLVSRAGDGWQVTVDDGGPGLSQAAYERGVGHFERFDLSRSRGNGGSGLGMSIMAGIVSRHQGELRLEPSPLGGLRTRIWLPEHP